MSFEDFRKNPSSVEINLSDFDPKNGFGKVFFGEKAVKSLERSIDSLEVDRVNVSKENLESTRALVYYHTILEKLLKGVKDEIKPLLTNDLEPLQLVSIVSKKQLNLKVDDTKPMQLITDGVSTLAHLGAGVREQHNIESEEPYFRVNYRSDLLTDAKKARADEKLRMEQSFVSEALGFKGSFSNMKKAFEMDSSLREFFINNPRFIETPVNFSAQIKKVNFADLPKVDFASLFGNSDTIRELQENLNKLQSMLKNTNMDTLDIKNLPMKFVELNRLLSQIEKATQLLQLDDNVLLMLNDTVKIGMLSNKAFEIEVSPNSNLGEKLMQTPFSTPVLSDEIRKNIDTQLTEKYVDAPRNTSAFLILSEPFKFESGENLKIKEDLTEKIDAKVAQTANLDQNVKNLFGEEETNSVKM